MNEPGSKRAPRAVAVPTAAHIAAARAVVARHLRPSPLLEIELPGSGGSFWAKLESLQPTGSFKIRGAYAALAAYGQLGRPIITASAGNHGIAVAEVARRMGLPATVVVSSHASPAKVDALRALGAHLVVAGDDFEGAEAHALDLANDGMTYVSPYNDPVVIAGQATCASEVFEQLPGELTMLVPVGGGGLAAGTGLVAELERPNTRIIGVEAAASRAVSAAVAAGRSIEVEIGETIADGLAGNIEPGSITPALVATRVHQFDAVTEREIRDAMRFLARHGILVEPSGAAGVASLLSGRVPDDGSTRVAILTGSNVTLSRLASILAEER